MRAGSPRARAAFARARSSSAAEVARRAGFRCMAASNHSSSTRCWRVGCWIAPAVPSSRGHQILAKSSPFVLAGAARRRLRVARVSCLGTAAWGERRGRGGPRWSPQSGGPQRSGRGQLTSRCEVPPRAIGSRATPAGGSSPAMRSETRPRVHSFGRFNIFLTFVCGERVAFERKRRSPDALLIGKPRGLELAGFDLGNGPSVVAALAEVPERATRDAGGPWARGLHAREPPPPM